MKVRALLALLPLIAGCNSSNPPPPKPADQTLQLETDAGQLAIQRERPEEAVARYQDALVRAQARDDLAAIGDVGYNLAVAELQAGHPDQALAVARSTEQEMTRRGAAPFPELILAEATALYRQGDLEAADRRAGDAGAGASTATTARATFLRGLIADDRNDGAGLAAASASLGVPQDPSLQADAAELSARLSLRRGDIATARQQAARAAALRQQTLDYRGLDRALALQAEAAARAGDAAAASDFYFRAGRSAAAQGDKPAARLWLGKAMAMTADANVRDAAAALLAKLGT